MDVDARVAVRDLGQHARHQRHLAALELVREPVDRGREEAGVGEDHLVDGVRGRVAVADRLGVEQQRRADVRQRGEEALDDVVRVRAVRLGQPQRVDQQRAQRGELVGHRAGAAADLGGEVREQQLQRAMDEALGELAQPRRQRVLLALPGELLQERRGADALGGNGHGVDTSAGTPCPLKRDVGNERRQPAKRRAEGRVLRRRRRLGSHCGFREVLLPSGLRGPGTLASTIASTGGIAASLDRLQLPISARFTSPK